MFFDYVIVLRGLIQLIIRGLLNFFELIRCYMGIIPAQLIHINASINLVKLEVRTSLNLVLLICTYEEPRPLSLLSNVIFLYTFHPSYFQFSLPYP